MKKLTRIFSTLLALVLLMGAMSVFTFAESALPFEDVKEKRWSYEYILKLFDAGIVNGRNDAVFAPTDNVTRAEFVKMLGGVAGIDPTAYSTKQFADVSKKAWYAGHVAWAVKIGVTTGMTKDTFAPTRNITREQMAAMICRYAQSVSLSLPNDNPIITFKDTKDIAPYAKDAVRQMQQAGIINGIFDASIGAYRFDPKANATREQAAKMLCVLYDCALSARRAEVFDLLQKFIADNANATDTAFSKFGCTNDIIHTGIATNNAAYIKEMELFYDAQRDEIGLTHYYHDSSGLEIVSTLCLPRNSGEKCYYRSAYSDKVIGTGYVNSAKLGRGAYEFHFETVGGKLKNDAASVAAAEGIYIQYLFEAVQYLNEHILPTLTTDFTARDLGFNV